MVIWMFNYIKIIVIVWLFLMIFNCKLYYEIINCCNWVEVLMNMFLLMNLFFMVLVIWILFRFWLVRVCVVFILGLNVGLNVNKD